jgi:octanoyl-[GcvH]:protein N-octanoyltransferase
MREIRLLTGSFTQPAAMDAAVSAAVLDEVSDGTAPETLRLYRPPNVVAFGGQDRLAPGFADAVAAARAGGFEATFRLAGGRAAVFHEGTVAFGWTRPDPDPRSGIHRRFEEVSALVVESLGALGVDARIGEVPGEYCPGRYSVNAAGRRKLMGVGQRLARSAAHVGGVIVVTGVERIRDVLIPVYRALGTDWDPSTVGGVEREVPSIGWDVVAGALTDAFSRRCRLVGGEIGPATLERASALVSRYQPA